MIYFKRASYEDLPTLAATRKKVWASTYRGIYPDEMIDNFDMQWHIARDRRRMEAANQAFYLMISALGTFTMARLTLRIRTFPSA